MRATRRFGTGRRLLLPTLALASLAACGGQDRASPDGGGAWRAARDTVGDTVVVRTLSGSIRGGEARLVEEVRIGALEGPEELTFGDVAGLAADGKGNVYVVDRQVPALRKYAPDGTHLLDFGRPGEGPGEIGATDGGVAVLPDGRVLLRDPGNARIQLYEPDGRPAGAWRIRGGWFISRPLLVDTAGRVHHTVFELREGETHNRLVRFAPEGTVLDTLPFPDLGHDTPLLEAVFRQGDSRSMSRRDVPFWPRETWSFSPLGYFVGGVSDRYAVTLLRPEGPLRIEREVPSVPVKSAEKADERERVTAMMRRTDPGWSWNGPDMPDEKPYYRSVLVARSGRIWVRPHVEAREAPPPEPDPEEEEPGAVPSPRWIEPILFDVFEPDGRYLGRVHAPDGFRTYPRPVLLGDIVWAVVEDELGVSYVVRYRVEWTTDG